MMFGSHPHIQKYLAFMRLRARGIPKIDSSEVALFELHMDYPTHIAYGEVAFYLRKKGIEPVGYKPILDLDAKSLLRLYIELYFNIDKGVNWPFHIFKAIGIKTFVIPTIGSWYKSRVADQWNDTEFNSKDDVLNYAKSGILIGDLFYDWHMNIRKLGTVDLKSKEFSLDFKKFLKTFEFWENYFNNNKVHSVFVSHTCYGQGLLTRIAINKGVPSMQITGDRMYRMSQNQLRADSEYLYYDPEVQEQFGYQISLERAKQQIAKLQSGRIDVDASHSQVSGYIGHDNNEAIIKSDRQKILIVAHCFSDSPNGFGIQLFPDYFEWLVEILKASENVPADWYIRPHPGFVHNDRKIFEDLITSFPHVKNVGLTNSIPSLIKQGINTVLTSHGTVGFEAALEGANVIGASQQAFYRNYNFVYIPKSREEWRDAISNLHVPKPRSFEPNQIYHYFDIHHLRSESSWLLREEYKEFLDKVGGLRRQFTNPEVFNAWMELSSDSHNLYTNQVIIEKFLEAEQYFYKYGSEM